MGRDGFAAADFAGTFVGFGFQIDLFLAEAERFRESRAHGWEMRTEFRAFANHHSIEVGDAQMLFVQELSGVFKEQQAGCALPFWIRVREMSADIAKASGAEQCVAQ